VAVGGDGDGHAYRGPGTTTIDLQGRTVVPGLTDTQPLYEFADFTPLSAMKIA
jgi:adenine deaminase